MSLDIVTGVAVVFLGWLGSVIYANLKETYSKKVKLFLGRAKKISRSQAAMETIHRWYVEVHITNELSVTVSNYRVRIILNPGEYRSREILFTRIEGSDHVPPLTRIKWTGEIELSIQAGVLERKEYNAMLLLENITPTPKMKFKLVL